MISFFHTFYYVLHYGPLEGSKDEESEVVRFRHGHVWEEPDRENPLSVVDKVLKKWLNTELNAFNKTNIDTGRTCPGLQVWGQPDPQRPFAVCAPEQEQQCNADRNNGYIYFIFIDMQF